MRRDTFWDDLKKICYIAFLLLNNFGHFTLIWSHCTRPSTGSKTCCCCQLANLSDLQILRPNGRPIVGH